MTSISGSFQTNRSKTTLVLALVLVVLAGAMLRLIPYDTIEALRGRDEALPNVCEFSVFGTYARLSFWAPADRASAAADEITALLHGMHARFNLFDAASELARLNAQAATSPFECSAELWAVLLAGRHAFEVSEGAFDISVGPLMRLWGFHRKRDELPSPQDIQATLLAVGLERVEFDDEAQTVRFSHPETYLDLGGIAKGYALDRAVALARKHGIRSGMLDLGGNIFCLEVPPPGKHAYTIGIRNPFDRDALLTTVQITNCAVSTSGNYEHYVTIAGKTMHHIIDPRTGYPIPDVAGVTVITPRGVDSDVFSTAVFVGGEALVESLRRAHRRTSVLHVSLDDTGRPVIKSYGWVWRGLPAADETADGQRR